jgi:hypothetical protein
MNVLIQDLDNAWVAFKNWVETEAGSALSFLVSFIKEAVTEEEAALFPDFQKLATQILSDEAKIQGLNVQERVAVIVADALAALPGAVTDAKVALFNSWAWAIAKQTGQINGNQGTSTTGDFSGNANSTPATS